MSWVQTYSGKRVDLLYPDPNSIDIEDIAHSLSGQPRFNYHTREFYSVAQHSILAASLVSVHLQKVALLHDASEYILSDLPYPLKVLLPEYKRIERNVQLTIYWRFGLSGQEEEELSIIDRSLALTEGRQLMGSTENWDEDRKFEPLDIEIIPWQPYGSKRVFLHCFDSLFYQDGIMPPVDELNKMALPPLHPIYKTLR